jgi:hypothetical protein
MDKMTIQILLRKHRCCIDLNHLFHACIGCFLFISISACGGTSNLPEKIDGELKSERDLKKVLLDPRFPASSMAYSGRVSIDSRDLNVSGTVKVYIENDKVCWLRLSKFGFEVGRFRITPDSIVGINKIQRTYIQAEIGEVVNLIGTDLSFSDIQNLVWGVPPRIDRNDKLNVRDSLFEVKSSSKKDNSEYRYLFQPPLDMILADWTKPLQNGTGSQHLNIKQSDFHKITDNKNFSYFRNYSFQSPFEKLAVELNISKLSLDETQSTDIRIPSSYTPY